MSTPVAIEHKRGDTFAPSCQLTEADGKTPASLLGVSIQSELRDALGNLVHTFAVQITNATLGKYDFSPFDTSVLALATYELDIKYSTNGMVDHTDVVSLKLVKTITL